MCTKYSGLCTAAVDHHKEMRSLGESFLLLLLMLSRDVISSEVLDLSELSWTVRGGDNQSISAEARLPGSVYTDLQTAGILGSLYYRFNDVEYRWVSLHNWTYSTILSLTPAQLQSRLIQLDCHGIDTVATILSNARSSREH